MLYQIEFVSLECYKKQTILIYKKMKVLNLLELRKEAQALGIENYAKYTKEELAKVIAAKKQGQDIVQDPEIIVTEEDKQELKEKVAEDGAEEISAEQAAEIDPNQKPKLTKEEKAAAKAAEREAKKEAAAKEKEAKKAEAKAKKEAEKAEKKAAKAALKAAMTNIRPKEGIEPALKAETSKKIYAELLKNDGRSYGTIARDLGSHYNMVRRIAETYFEPVATEAVAEAKTEAQSAETTDSQEAAE